MTSLLGKSRSLDNPSKGTTMDAGFNVLLRLERHDGNDPIEAEVRLPIIPRKGDQIEVWNREGGWLNSDGHGGTVRSGEEGWLTVDDVVLCAWAPERIEAWVSMEGYDLELAERLMDAAGKVEQP